MDHIVLALILSCSVHPDDHLVEALAAKLSLNNAFFVGDLSTLETYDTAKSVDEATRIVTAIRDRGGRPAVGYMAVPVGWGSRFGRSLSELFDGCTNIGIGTSILSGYARACSVRRLRKRGVRSPVVGHQGLLSASRACLLHRLEADMNLRGIAKHVLPVAAQLDVLSGDLDLDSPPAQSPIFPDDNDTGDAGLEWSSPRLFAVPAAPSPTPPRAGPAGGRPPSASAPPSPPYRPGPNRRPLQSPERP